MTERSASPAAGTGPDALVPRKFPGWLVAVLLLVLTAAVVGGSYLLGGVYGKTSSRFLAQSPIAKWSAAVRSDPANVAARVQLGYVYQGEGRYKEALAEYALVIQKDPSNTAALYNQGTIHRELGEDDRFVASMLQVLEVQQDHVMAAKALGEHYAAAQQYESLLSIVVPVVAAHPAVADLHYLAGLGFEQTGDSAKALEEYRAAVELADTPEARAAIARLAARP